MREDAVRDLLPGAEATVELDGEHLPVAARAQVVVAGGGPAGAFAAIAAGRHGADVILVEAQPSLGGVGTGGAIHWYYWGVSGGLQDELDRRDAELDERISARTRGFHPEARKVELARMAREAGVELRLRCCVVGAIVEENAVRGVVIDGPDRRAVLLADVVIDATGDADVAALAGARFEMGRSGDELPMAYSLTPGVSRDEWHVWHSNYDAGWVDPTDPWDYSRGFTHGRKYLWRKEFGDERRFHFCAPVLGVRESRRIVGDYVLTLDDLFAGRCFEDTVGRTRSHYDNHARDYAPESELARIFVDVTGNFSTALECDVPYRSLLPGELDGLLVAGRCISMTHDAEQPVRMQKDMQRIGEAAGTAAAMATADGVTPREVDVARLQRELIKSGVLTEAQVEAGREGRRLRPPRAVAELIDELGGDRPAVAMFELYRHGDDALDALHEAMASGDDDRARRAALVAGALGSDEARPMLVRMLVERDERAPADSPFVQPRWVSALALLALQPDEALVEVLMLVLQEETPHAEGWLYALEALERIGSPEAAPAVHGFLDRLREDERFWHAAYDPKRHPGWKVEIAAARALRAMGDADGVAIIRRYADDDRLPVRRYARKLLA